MEARLDDEKMLIRYILTFKIQKKLKALFFKTQIYKILAMINLKIKMYSYFFNTYLLLSFDFIKIKYKDIFKINSCYNNCTLLV